jgi:ligand-binding SRPBCC domain-containing protein
LTAQPRSKEESGRRSEQQKKERLSFIAEQWVPFPVEQVFAFIADLRNLPRLMPRWQDTRIDSLELHAPEGRNIPGAAGRGSRILLSFRPVPLSPIRLRWLGQIDEYVSDHHFCDLQVTGPFGYWRHCHLVRPEAHGDANGTRVIDVVDYQWLRGAANRAIDVIGGRLQLCHLFHYRQRKLVRLLRQNSVQSRL